MSKNKVMVVDDNEDVLLIYDKILSRGGYEIFKATNGRECIEQAKKCSPDIIVMDIMMPELDGIATVLKLKGIEETRSIPIIVSTAVKESEDEIVAQHLGVAGYFRKTPDMKGLLEKIEGILK